MRQRKLIPGLALGLAFALVGCGGSAAPSSASQAPAAASAKSGASAGAASNSAPAASKPASQSGAAAGASGVIKVTTSYSNLIPDELPLWVAKDGGIFEKNGLDVEMQFVKSAAEVPALVSNQVQIYQGGGAEALSAAVGGADVLVVATISPVYPFVFEVPASIKTPADLKGKKVGVSGFGTVSDIAARAGLKKIGIDPDKDVSIVQVGSARDRRAAMESGAIQGGVAQPPDSIELEASGFHPLFSLADLKVPATSLCVVTARAYASSHREVVQKYVDSIVQAIAREKKDRAFTVSVLGKYLKMDKTDELNKTWDFYTTQVAPSVPLVTREQFADAVDVLAQKNEKVKSFDLTKLFDNSFVESAKSRGLAG